MSRFCPWCREPLGLRQRRDQVCPHCGRPLKTKQGELRPIDLRYEEVEAAQRRAFQQVSIYGSAVAAVIFLLLPLLHLAISTVLVVPLALLAHMLALRIVLIRQARSLLSRSRRFFLRWICRLSILWLGTIGYSMTAVPVIGVIPGVVTFVGLTALVHFYTLWSLDRERQGQPLALWEKLTLIGLALMTVTLIVAMAVIAALVGWSLSQLIEMFSGG
jgi:hypothetical protein